MIALQPWFSRLQSGKLVVDKVVHPESKPPPEFMRQSAVI